MKIIQVAHAVTQDDGASRHLLNQDRILRQLGYDAAVYAHKVDPRLQNEVRGMESFAAAPEDILIYHMTTGTSFNRWVYRYPRKIVLYYQNITPARFFFGSAWGSWWKCLRGRRDLVKIVANSFFGWGASEYSRRELADLGLSHTSVLPIVMDMERFRACEKVPALEQRYRDGRRNILIVGRGVPHKKQDQAIAAIAWYRDHISPAVRLVIIGNIKPSYNKKLRAMAAALRLEDQVLFAGQVSRAELCTWYQIADAVLSLSEHEGFCMPLVEAMAFEKPVFAYDAAAVPETLGQGGVLLKDKAPEYIARTIHDTLADPAALAALAAGRAERLDAFSQAAVTRRLAQDMEKIIALWGQQPH